MADQNPTQNVPQDSFLRIVKQGQTWIHKDMGKVRITGVIRDRSGNVLEVNFKQLTPAPERAAEYLKFLASGMEKQHITQPRRVRETVEYAPNNKAA